MEKISSRNESVSATNKSYDYEYELWEKNALLCGIDEVGRGCLCGPVVACCAILHPFVTHPNLKDSKILTENQREEVALWLQSHSWYAFGIIDHKEIDAHNIYEATKQAMQKAYYGLTSLTSFKDPELVLIDAVPLTFGTNGPKVVSMTKGESKSVSIAAASILAKVYRDNIMKRLDTQFPGYYLCKNKGYGAQIHTDRLRDQGSSLIHRQTFLSSLYNNKKSKKEFHDNQTSLFC